METGDSFDGLLCGIVQFSLAQHATSTAGIQEPLVFMKVIKLLRWREAVKVRASACLVKVNSQT